MRAVALRIDQPVMTRDGRAARVLTFTSDHTEGPYPFPVVAEVEHPNEVGSWLRWHYMANGQWKSNDPANPNDLIPLREWTPDPTHGRRE